MPPNEIKREQSAVLMARQAAEPEIKRQPFVISKRPIITPFESVLSIPKFSKRI